ncbi:MAG TPA: DUF4097 family beta strand repeat-containing protein [Mycobacteriales bacterium]
MNVLESGLRRTFDTPRPVTLLVEQVSGRLEIETTGHGSTQVRVTALNPDAEGAADYVARTRVDLDGDRLEIQMPHGNALRRKHPQVLTQVTLPEGSAVELRSAATTLTTDGALGDVQVKSAGGAVTVDQARDVTIRTAAGDVEVGQASGRVSVKSASSRVSVGRAAGLEVKGAAGEVHAVRLTGDVTIQTAAGNVRIDALGAGNAKIEGKLANLEIGVVAGIDVHLDLQTGIGVVDCELDQVDGPRGSGGQLDLRANSATGRVHVYRSVV